MIDINKPFPDEPHHHPPHPSQPPNQDTNGDNDDNEAGDDDLAHEESVEPAVQVDDEHEDVDDEDYYDSDDDDSTSGIEGLHQISAYDDYENEFESLVISAVVADQEENDPDEGFIDPSGRKSFLDAYLHKPIPHSSLMASLNFFVRHTYSIV